MGNRRKKNSTFKNVMISLGCAAFAGIYGIGGFYLLTTMTGNGGNGALPAWMNRVEIHVNEDSDARVDGQTVTEEAKQPENGSDDHDTYSESIEQKPRFQEETQPDKETEDTVTQDSTGKKDQETSTAGKPSANQDRKDEKEEETETWDDEDSTSEEQTETEDSDDKADAEETDSENTDSKKQDSKKESDEKSEKKKYVTVENVQTVDRPDAQISVVTDVVKAAMPCVVAVTNEYTAYDYWYDEMVDETICGSGIVVAQNDEELLIVTNFHVIEDSNALHVQFIDEEEATAYVKGTSPDNDIAIISVALEDLSDETLDSIAIAALGDSDELQVGEPAIAIGNSLGYGQSVTTGVISALNRTIYTYDEEDMNTEGEPNATKQECLIQTDAAINPGNSGGALLNVKGEVIGINSSKIADYVIEGVGYAIPISVAKPIIEDLMQRETRKKVPEEERGFLGISGTDVSEDAMEQYDMPEGVFVSKVLEDTPAEKAGILKGDIIISIDGEKVTQMKGVQNLLEYYAAGTEVEVTFMRQSKGEYKEMTVDVTLGYKDE